jgi:hypothetical protein
VTRPGLFLLLVLLALVAWTGAGRIAVSRKLDRRARRALRRAALTAAVVVAGALVFAAGTVEDDRLVMGAGVLLAGVGGSSLLALRRKWAAAEDARAREVGGRRRS